MPTPHLAALALACLAAGASPGLAQGKKDPKAKKPAAPAPVSADAAIEKAVDAALAANFDADSAEAKKLGEILGEPPTVASSAHVSVKGRVSREEARDALIVAETAYAGLNEFFGWPPTKDVILRGLGKKLHCFFLPDAATMREALPYVEATYGRIDAQLRKSVETGGGLAAGGTRPCAMSKVEGPIKTHVLHQLGQVYVDSITGDAAPFLHEGFGIYVAVRWGGKNTTYCSELGKYVGSVDKATKGQDTAYLLLCQEAAENKNDATLETLAAKKLNALDDVDLAKSFSFVRMLLETNADQGKSFLKLYDVKNFARTVKASFGMTAAELDAHWRELHK